MWPKVVTFDCYGTLVRWPETLRTVFDSITPSGADVARFHKDFGEFHVQLKKEPYQPYAQVLRLALSATMKKWNLDGIAQAQERLLHDISAIAPYPDVIPALRSIARKFRLAIISNTEDALIAETVRGLGVQFEVVTAEQAKAYKPDHRLFRYAHARLGVSAGDVLHVGAGYATDMVPAFELSLARVWINRRGEQADPAMPPTAELPDLSGLEATIANVARDRDAGSSA
jgi:2-haloacid dehalogenase